MNTPITVTAATATYRAWFKNAPGDIAPTSKSQIFYEHKPRGNLVGELPLGSRPLPRGECGSLDRTDGGDPFESALFVTPSGRTIMIERDK